MKINHAILRSDWHASTVMDDDQRPAFDEQVVREVATDIVRREREAEERMARRIADLVIEAIRNDPTIIGDDQ